MKKLKIALLQINGTDNDPEANLRKGRDACRKAKGLGADMALFPEMWSHNYSSCPQEEVRRKAWTARAIDEQDAWITTFKDLAIELRMAIVVTYLSRKEENLFNSAVVIDRNGQLILTYEKIHTCDFGVEQYLTPGDAFHVAELDTDQGPIKIGAMICFDREFPESARILMLKGAEIILVPNSCDLEMNRLAQIRTRSFENMVVLAVANYPKPKNNGHSAVFDGMAFTENGKSRDTIVVEAREDETVLIAEIDINALRAYREREVWGNAYRKPASYEALISKEVEEPFIRANAKR